MPGVSRWPGLSVDQSALVDAWFPRAELVADHSWGLVESTVLQLRRADLDGDSAAGVTVKAGGPGNHHVDRELTAHETVVAPLAELGAAPRLLHGDRDRRVLATTFLPGTLVQGHPAEGEPDTYRQAGRLLAVLHGQAAREDPTYDEREDAEALARLGRPHRVGASMVERLRKELTSSTPDPRPVVPTHGDWQPRNWLVDGNRVLVIDFGRTAWRPVETDLVRLAAQQLAGRQDLEEAFYDGYGRDPREAASWRRALLREAVGTAVYAHQVGEEAFEQHGHRMIAALYDT